MSGGYISYFNASTAFSDAELQSAVADFQSQVANEFNWYWGLYAYLDINGSGTPVIIVDQPGPNDPQGALGYHTVDANHQPYAVIFAQLCQQYGVPITGVISHETLEMLADQEVDTVNLIDNGDGTGIIVIQEVCDPCEQQLYYEGPNGNIVSDFALPGWWVPGYPYGVDFLGALAGPLQLASGGYTSYQYVTLSGWQQVFGAKAQQDIAKAAEAMRMRVASSGDPRFDLVRQLRMGRGVQQRQLAGQGAGTGPEQAQQATAELRRQTAHKPGHITVVKRQDVPIVGHGQMPARAAGRGAPQQPAAATGRTKEFSPASPKIQRVPEKT